MKAITYTEYGSPDVLQIKKFEKPTPKDTEILVRVYTASVNYGDLLARNFKAVTPKEFNMPSPLWFISRLFFGLNKPRISILGSEFAGIVEAVGADVTRFKVGDAVFGYLGQNMGTYAEYLTMPENAVVAKKPENITFEEATSIPMGGMTALSLLKNGNIQPGQKVLINGASGSIGSIAVQLAKHYGAEVTGVCSTPRVEMVKALGADKVIDYKKEDFTQNGETYDLILDVLGRASFGSVKNSLTENGIYLLASFKLPKVFQMLWTSLTGSSKKVICALAPESAEDLEAVRELIEAGVVKSIVDKCYPMEQAADAHRYAESGKKTGHVVITMVQAEEKL